MFNNISWQGYWVTIALLTAAYYLVIYLIYFRKDIRIHWGRNAAVNSRDAFPSLPSLVDPKENKEASYPSSLSENEEAFQMPEKDSLEHTVYACMDEINAYLQEAKKVKCVKKEMMYALHAILRKYPGLSTSEYKESLTHVIVNQCEYLCSVHLSAEDAVQVWVGW